MNGNGGDNARRFVAACCLVAPCFVVIFDGMLLRFFGHNATITGVVRHWSSYSKWPEVLYIVGVVLLYYHFFRNWP